MIFTVTCWTRCAARRTTPFTPSSNIAPLVLCPAAPGTLEVADTAVPEIPMTLRSPLSVGLFAGKWCSYAAPPDLPHDQREEDGGALVFTGPPLGQPLEILGAPVLELELAADRPVAMLAAATRTRVTYGLLNLTHRDGSAAPVPLKPGRRYRVRLQLNEVGQVFPAGHRLRLSLSTSYWPLAWPPPQPVRLSIFTGHGRLVLPRRPRRDAEDDAIRFAPVQGARPTPQQQLEPGCHRWRVIRDLVSDRSTLEVINDAGLRHVEAADIEMRRAGYEWYRHEDDDFASPVGETRWDWRLQREGWSVRTITHTRLGCDATHFHLHAHIDAYEGEDRVYSDDWNLSIPRDLV